MLELYMVACLLAEPAKCQDVRLDFVNRNTTPWTILHQGETMGAQWIERHPGYFVGQLGTRQIISVEAHI